MYAAYMTKNEKRLKEEEKAEAKVEADYAFQIEEKVKTPLQHCEEVYHHQSKIDGDKSDSYHRAQLMEAAEKLKGISMKDVTIYAKDGYTGGFKNGKKHGFGLYYYYDKGFAGNSSYCDYSSTW